MNRAHAKATKKYDIFREEARSLAHDALPRRLKSMVNLGGVDSRALVEFKTWQNMPERKVDWDWNFASSYSFRYPKAFDLSVWYGTKLCSMTLGRPSFKGTSMRMDFLERLPVNCPIAGDVFGISLLAYETYGRLIGADYIRLVEPMNEKLIQYYTSVDMGFSFRKAKQGNPHYLVKKL